MPFNKDGTPWSPETGHLALRDIRKQVIADLNARDERLSRGQLNAENHYSPYREVPKENNQGSSFIVDPLLSSIRHTGEDTILLTEKRWREFTAEPQDEKPYRDKLIQRSQVDKLNAAKTAGQAVEDSLASVAEADLPVMPKPKPKTKEPALIG
ncbi:MAG: hypothetical protein KAJ19_10165 [Gammaproteobacteria bacterium]|nr:hypothetical protein [Gammaproteobacteria bacterium]